MFTKDSIVAKTWVNAVKKGDKKLEDVPNLSNLIAVVSEILEGGETNV